MEYKKIVRTSPSNIISFISDYPKWYQNYVLGIKQPDNVYFQFGTAFHGLLEDFFNDNPKTGEDLKTYTTRKYAELFKKWFEENTELKIFFDEELGITMETSSDWTYNYLKQWLKETLPMENKYGTEKAFQYNSPSINEWHLEDEELRVHGYMDSYYGKDKWNPASGFINFHSIEDSFPIVEEDHLTNDYKTSKLTRTSNNTKYYLQCMIYALMFKRQNKRKSMNFLCVDYLKYNMKHFYRVDEQALSNIERMIKDYWVIVEEINEHPELYESKPPKRLKLSDYI